jgi:hypothetical protein
VIVFEVQGNRQCPVERGEYFAAQDTYEVGQRRLRRADQFVALYAALVLQTLLDPDRILRAQGVVQGIHGSTDIR